MAKSKRALIFILLGVIMLSVGMWIFFTYEEQDVKAGKNADVLLAKLDDYRKENSVAIIEESFGNNYIKEEKMETVRYGDYDIIGEIVIPDLDIKLPVLAEWTYEKLDAAPCRYYGSIYEDTFVIMGHNYRRHFAPLNDISVGTPVIFRDVMGRSYMYTVDETEKVDEAETQKLFSDHELVLFTCTPGGQSRMIVRCSKD